MVKRSEEKLRAIRESADRARRLTREYAKYHGKMTLPEFLKLRADGPEGGG